VSGDERPDLDEELRRLFADDRLTVPVAEGATGAVIAGARRRRRHRMAVAAAGGVLAVTGLVFAGAALTGIGRPLGTVTAATGLSASLTATSAPSTTPSAVASNLLLGPYGAEGMQLGSSIKIQQKTGLRLTPVGQFANGKCTGYTLLVPTAFYYSRDPAGSPTVPEVQRTSVPSPTTKRQVDSQGLPVATASLPEVSRKPMVIEAMTTPDGTIIQIGGSTSLRTPEGVGVGSSVQVILRTYARYERQYDGKKVVVRVPGNPKASYVFTLDGTGTADQMWLTATPELICPR
jgi:hypothetical protein